MFVSHRYIAMTIVCALSASPLPAWACEICTIPRIGKQKILTDDAWFAEYYFELQNWKEIDAREAHELHHDGHHVHDKTKEYIHHYSLGRRVTEDLTIIADLPYVIRKSLEIHDHDTLGSEIRSEGLGDLHLMGLYRFWNAEDTRHLSAVGGIKIPTGETKETSPTGERFETELQPGSGSFDYLIGGVYRSRGGASELTSNLVYVFKTEGAQDYAFGDTVVASVLWQYVTQTTQNTLLKMGVDASIQYEQKHQEDGATVKDSGGVTLLMGPSFTFQMSEQASIFASVQFPALQHLGGKHQEIESVWNTGIKLSW